MNRLQRAWSILLTGREPITQQPSSKDASTDDDDLPGLQSRISRLEMDIEERDKKIERITKEFSQLRRQSEKETGAAGMEAITELSKKAAPILTQIVTMRALFEQGKDIKAKDLLKIFGKIERIFHQTSLTQIGEVGEETLFESRIHQRLSGGSVHDGNEVVVRFVGYELDQSVLVKALVSKRGDDGHSP